jgi:hypothetical protein
MAVSFVDRQFILKAVSTSVSETAKSKSGDIAMNPNNYSPPHKHQARR